MKEVKFLGVHPPYLIGEVAKFEDRVAVNLVEIGVAEYVSRPLSKNLDAPPVDKMVRKQEIKTK